MLIIILFIIISLLTYYPVVFVLRFVFSLFKGSSGKDFEIIAKNVKVVKKVKYGAFKDHIFDYYTPKNKEIKGTIFWVHGGAYVAGDKSDVSTYAYYLANSGYQVINLNYRRAPFYKYPLPLIDIGLAYKFVLNNNEQFQVQDTNIYFAGDSAGAQIISQFVCLQTNSKYAQTMEIEAVVKKEISGLLLFCGVYDLEKLMATTKNIFVKYFYHNIGWAYNGSFSWRQSEKLSQCCLENYLTASFPPTFITDGNKFTFTNQGKEFGNKLKEKKLIVEEVYYEDVKISLYHEYQFQMKNKYGIKTFEHLIKFMDKN